MTTKDQIASTLREALILLKDYMQSCGCEDKYGELCDQCPKCRRAAALLGRKT